MRTSKFAALIERLTPLWIPLLYAAALLLISPLHDTFEEWDGVVQIFAGKEVVSGLGYTGLAAHRWPPLFALLSGLGSQIMPGFEAAKLVSGAAGAILVYVAYALALELSGKKKVAVLAQGFLVVNPWYAILSLQAENHMLDSLFFVSALTLFLKALRSPAGRRWAITGLFAGLAGLCRYTSYTLLPIFVIALFLLFNARQALKATVMLTISFALVNLPWWVANAVASGSPFANTLYLNTGWNVIANGNYRWWWDTHTGYSGIVDILTANPRGYILNAASNIYASGKMLLTTAGALALFVIPAAFDAVISLKPRHWVVLFGGLLLYTLVVSQAVVFHEVFLNWIVVFCMLSVIFLHKYFAQIAQAYPLLGKRRFSLLVISTLLLAGLALTSWRVYGYIKWDDYDNGQMTDYREITAVLKERDPDIARKYVMSINPARAYYLNSAYLPPPLYYEDSVDGLVVYRGIRPAVEMLNLRFPSNAQRDTARADYLIYDEGLRSHLPQFAFLFNPASEQIPGNFSLVYHSKDAVVYEILWQ